MQKNKVFVVVVVVASRRRRLTGSLWLPILSNFIFAFLAISWQASKCLNTDNLLFFKCSLTRSCVYIKVSRVDWSGNLITFFVICLCSPFNSLLKYDVDRAQIT